MQSKATTVADYLDELPEDRQSAISAVRAVILKNIDSAFEEGMQYGMIGYYVPHRLYPAGYHCDPKQPLPFCCLASQKNHMALYCMALYMDGDQENSFRKDWAKTGKKLDMGKSCIRFKKVDDLALDVIAAAFKRLTLKKYIATYEQSLAQAKVDSAERSASKKKTAKQSSKKAAAKKATKKAVAKKVTKTKS